MGSIIMIISVWVFYNLTTVKPCFRSRRQLEGRDVFKCSKWTPRRRKPATLEPLCGYFCDLSSTFTITHISLEFQLYLLHNNHQSNVINSVYCHLICCKGGFYLVRNCNLLMINPRKIAVHTYDLDHLHISVSLFQSTRDHVL